jgi:hypothetical protein
MERNRLPNPGDDRIPEDIGKDGKLKNTMSFKGRSLETQPLFMFMNKRKKRTLESVMEISTNLLWIYSNYGSKILTERPPLVCEVSANFSG